MKQFMKFGVAAVLVVLGLIIGTKQNHPLFALDAVSAATDGSECTDPTWVGCAIGWLEKGYVYDNAKGYYVKTSASTAKNTTQATTAKVTTTKASVTTTAKSNAGSQTQTTVTSTSAATETTEAKTNVAGLQTKATYTNKPRTSPAVANRNKKDTGNATLLSVIPINLLIGVLISLVVMVAEFFVVKTMYLKK